MNKKNHNAGTALITGGAKRVGKEMALDLAKKGYDLVISYNSSKDDADDLVKEISRNFNVKCEIFQADLTNQEAAKKLANFMVSNFSNWNLLINNASIFNKSQFTSGSELEMFNNINLHLISPLFLSKEFAKNIQSKSIENAHIINMVDKDIMRYDSTHFYYLLSKKSLGEFTKMLSVELAPKIRVNGIAPGFIINSVNCKDPEAETKYLKSKIPLKSQGGTKSIVKALDFLLNNEFITGQIIFVDGGASLKLD